VYFEATIDVDAPPEAVWAVVSDVELWPEWTDSISKVEKLDSGPLRVGTRAKVSQPRLPTVVWQVTEVDEPNGFAWRAGLPGARSVADHRIEARPEGGSRVTLSIDMTGSVGALLARMTAGMTRRYLEMEARGLKSRVEAAS
jgi:uncharacterized membrane protein